MLFPNVPKSPSPLFSLPLSNCKFLSTDIVSRAKNGSKVLSCQAHSWHGNTTHHLCLYIIPRARATQTFHSATGRTGNQIAPLSPENRNIHSTAAMTTKDPFLAIKNSVGCLPTLRTPYPHTSLKENSQQTIQSLRKPESRKLWGGRSRC